MYESTAYSCTRTALYSFTITGRPFVYNYSTVLVQRCIIVQYEGNFEGKEHKTLESTCTTVALRKYNYFRTFESTFVRKYESTFKVLSYESTFESTFVRKYHTKVRRYEGTFVQLSSQVRKYFRTFVQRCTVYSCTRTL